MPATTRSARYPDFNLVCFFEAADTHNIIEVKPIPICDADITYGERKVARWNMARVMVMMRVRVRARVRVRVRGLGLGIGIGLGIRCHVLSVEGLGIRYRDRVRVRDRDGVRVRDRVPRMWIVEGLGIGITLPNFEY
jgi:hypothetical protein